MKDFRLRESNVIIYYPRTHFSLSCKREKSIFAFPVSSLNGDKIAQSRKTIVVYFKYGISMRMLWKEQNLFILLGFAFWHATDIMEYHWP